MSISRRSLFALTAGAVVAPAAVASALAPATELKRQHAAKVPGSINYMADFLRKQELDNLSTQPRSLTSIPADKWRALNADRIAACMGPQSYDEKCCRIAEWDEHLAGYRVKSVAELHDLLGQDNETLNDKLWKRA